MAPRAARRLHASHRVHACRVQGELGYEGQHDEFGQTLCETMATLGSQHLGSLSTHGKWQAVPASAAACGLLHFERSKEGRGACDAAHPPPF